MNFNFYETNILAVSSQGSSIEPYKLNNSPFSYSSLSKIKKIHVTCMKTAESHV